MSSPQLPYLCKQIKPNINKQTKFSETAMDFPPDHFLCPISRELMKDPVTILTGVTYDRHNIEKWFFSYNKITCPATMQKLSDFHITPNHTLKRLILSWQNPKSPIGSVSVSVSVSSSPMHAEILDLLATIDSSPFKVSSLKKLRSIIETGDDTKTDLIRSDGVEVLIRILVQILVLDNSDFVAFRACEESIAVLHQLALCDEGKLFDLLSKPDPIKSMVIMLQRASAETRLHTLSILRNMAKTEFDWSVVIQDHGADFFKSLLEFVSDEICAKASSCALEVLIEILRRSKKSRLRAIEAGAVCVLVELLPDSNRSKCEKILHLIKLLCESAEGRLALVEHKIAIAAVSKKMLHVSGAATKMAVKVVWLVCNFHPTERVLEEMLVCGAVKKLLALLHLDGRSSTKDKVVKIFRLHGNSWRKYPCFPVDFRNYLGYVNVQ